MIRLVAACLLSALVASQAFGAERARDLPGILASGVLRVGIIKAQAPPFIVHEQERVHGVDALMARDVARQLGVDLELAPLADTYNGLVEAMARGEADMALSDVSITLPRLKKVLFSEPYARFHSVMLVRREWAERMKLHESDGLLDWEDFPAGRIASVAGSAYAGFSRQFFPDSPLELFPDLEAAYQALRAGRADMVFYNDHVQRFFLQDPAAALSLAMIGSDKPDPVGAVLPKGSYQLKTWLDNYIRLSIPEFDFKALWRWYEDGMQEDILKREEAFRVKAAGLFPLSSPRRPGGSGRPWLAGFVAAAGLLAFPPLLVRMRREPSAIAGLKSWLHSRWPVLLGVALGVALGLWRARAGLAMETPARIFLAALKVCSLPMMIAAVVSSIARLARKRLGRDVLRFAGMLAAGASGVVLLVFVLGAVARPGAMLSTENRNMLGRMVMDQEAGMEASGSEISFRFMDNLFRALSEDQLLVVMLFCILLGVALGLSRDESSRRVVRGLETVFQALLLVVNWLVKLLPLGLFALMAWTVAHLGWEVVLAMRRYLLVYAAASAAIVLAAVLVIAWRLRRPPLQTVSAIKSSLLMALMSGNVHSALPLLFNETAAMPVDQNHVKLTLPIGLLFFDVKKLALFCLAGVFFAQLFAVPLGQPHVWAAIVLGSLACSVLTVGMKSAAYLGAAALILQPLGAPASSSVALLFAVYPFVDLLGAAASLAANAALSICSGRPDAATPAAPGFRPAGEPAA